MANIAELLSNHPEIIESIAQARGKGKVLNYEVQGKTADGEFSAGHAVDIETEDGHLRVFISQPSGNGFGLTNDISTETQGYMESQRSVVGSMEPLHLFMIDETGHVFDISKVTQLLRVAEHLPDGALNVFNDLRATLREKWDDDKVTEHFGPITQQVVDILTQLHTQEVPEDIQQKAGALYSESLWRIHSDRELFSGLVHSQNFREKSWTNLRQMSQIRSLMEEFEHLTRDRKERLRPLHGDAWWRNTYRTPNGKVVMIDQSRSAYGEPAIDVVMAVGDAINSSIIRQENGQGPFTDIAQQGIDTYIGKTNDEVVLEMFPLVFAFKTTTLALLNPVISEQSRRDLVAAGYGSLQLAVEALREGRPFRFSLSDLPTYISVGTTALAEV
ncbi:hypothetical protein H3C70_00965 [Patescibacteria group bacterium]|nr:hypothetical protein [Patescibacteria group bacterium]